ncbi:alpha-ketoglutarate-dependent dioxygenase AlkB [Aquabacterium sp. J223]|uniref:alpha-ketoglutarate-dependent dioxygenase AlkB n=1 Tax=Aquabacterium sp. J223 TaxID=2898431 RepID=UPI0021ADD27F|nr:alpha-ketoglutarate-dependent dioxygenase AlkB [Aquabacterium sp. J223]UUX96200.1 alpha-ketoglutarate-dependent dioxygenase AlkB [Aquabacterium sp. J223]
MPQADLFAADADGPPGLPDGLRLQAPWLSVAEEGALLARIAALPLAAADYHGHLARRRVLAFGHRFDFAAGVLRSARPLPDWLAGLRDRAAAWAGLPAPSLTDALIAEYRPGTPLGWHRDVPDYEDVVGLSLGGEAVMGWRRWRAERRWQQGRAELPLPPRSIYALQGEARWGWQHAILPTPGLRHSITFRSLRRREAPP